MRGQPTPLINDQRAFCLWAGCDTTASFLKCFTDPRARCGLLAKHSAQSCEEASTRNGETRQERLCRPELPFTPTKERVSFRRTEQWSVLGGECRACAHYPLLERTNGPSYGRQFRLRIKTGKVCQSRRGCLTDSISITGTCGKSRHDSRLQHDQSATRARSHDQPLSHIDNPGGDDGPAPFAKSKGPGLFHFLPVIAD